ncbi:MAG: 16S rRNA (adenine(1518)-N(6)/adenine(1519)-N(6))-dimethyltransferase, partial [Clostridia bacterium]|nr:16S rRNA (adenine(1518)-N(6)/adenine(1519)-N(6))-dimethyltransferase [Clostridia bacterium]
KDKYYIKDIEKFRKLVKTALAMRRKTLVNNLMKGYQMDRAQAEELLSSIGVPVTVRGEELSVSQFVELSNKT